MVAKIGGTFETFYVFKIVMLIKNVTFQKTQNFVYQFKRIQYRYQYKQIFG